MIWRPSIQELCIHHVYTGPWASQLGADLTQHWSDTDDIPHQSAGGMGTTSMLLPFSPTSLCLSFLEYPRHLSPQILMWHILLNRVVVIRTQQELASLLHILHLEVVRALHTDQAYVSPQKRSKKKQTPKRGERKRDQAKLPNTDASPWLKSHSDHKVLPGQRLLCLQRKRRYFWVTK